MKPIANACWLAAAMLPGLVAAADYKCSAPGITPINLTSAYTDILDDGTVIDPRTGLMWKRCAEGQAFDPDTASCTGDPVPIPNWKTALEEAGKRTSFAGHDDWRLPNIKELFSLSDLCNEDLRKRNTAVFPPTRPAPDSVNWFSNSVAVGNTSISSPPYEVYMISFRGYIETYKPNGALTGIGAIRMVRDVDPQ